ncbi:hypothetical protein COOONC_03320 [Cooperia oncophora]
MYRDTLLCQLLAVAQVISGQPGKIDTVQDWGLFLLYSVNPSPRDCSTVHEEVREVATFKHSASLLETGSSSLLETGSSSLLDERKQAVVPRLHAYVIPIREKPLHCDLKTWQSTVTLMLETMTDWTTAFDAKKSVDLIDFDFQKAFNKPSYHIT